MNSVPFYSYVSKQQPIPQEASPDACTGINRPQGRHEPSREQA